MKSIDFQSVLAPDLQRFRALRQLSGTDYFSQARLLKCFDDYLQRIGWPTGRVLTGEVLDVWVHENPALHPRTLYNRYSVLRCFCEYLQVAIPQTATPTPVKSKRDTSRKPYIFTSEELKRIVDVAGTLKCRKRLRARTYQVLFGLMASTGLRIGEAVSLTMNDVRLGTGLLRVVGGKFRKDRDVPLSATTADQLQRYVQERSTAFLGTASTLFFSADLAAPLPHPSVRGAFRRTLQQCAIHLDGPCSPRIHDFRHTFAVHCLMRWYRQGVDINTRLPHLATYMGHVNIISTQVYLQATAELLNIAGDRFLQFARTNILATEV